MDPQELIAHARRLTGKLRDPANVRVSGELADGPQLDGLQAQTVEFLVMYAGQRSQFAKAAAEAHGYDRLRANKLASVLDAFVDYVESGLASGLSPERKGQLDVVSDLLQQAGTLLEDERIHPAAPAVLIGATLEEFLRTWAEAAGVGLSGRKPGLSAYASVLREADLLQKQDVKDIESWVAFGIMPRMANGMKSAIESEFD